MPEDAVDRISEVLRVLSLSTGERISLGAVAEVLGRRQLGIIILCLALPNCLPGPYVPGVSTLLAVPIMWLGARLALGRGEAGLPGFLRRVTFQRERFVRFVVRATPFLLRMERWVTRRPSFLTAGTGRRCLGVVLTLYALALALPVPLGNIPISFAIVVIALGLIEDDGRALAVGLALGVVGCLWLLLLVTLGVEAIIKL